MQAIRAYLLQAQFGMTGFRTETRACLQAGLERLTAAPNWRLESFCLYRAKASAPAMRAMSHGRVLARQALLRSRHTRIAPRLSRNARASTSGRSPNASLTEDSTETGRRCASSSVAADPTCSAGPGSADLDLATRAICRLSQRRHPSTPRIPASQCARRFPEPTAIACRPGGDGRVADRPGGRANLDNVQTVPKSKLGPLADHHAVDRAHS